MTAYHGGKQRIGKELAQVIYNVSIEKEQRTLALSGGTGMTIKGYCEPFCGMLGVYQHIPNLFESRVPKMEYKAGDLNNSVILMWQATQDGWIPPTKCIEGYYNELKYDGTDTAEKGFLGHQLGFAGQYFKGYAPKYSNIKTSSTENASNRVTKISNLVHATQFSYGEYTQYSNLKDYIIYCDPPYNNTHQRYTSSFDSDKFWAWCESMSKNNIVFVSEYMIPKNIHGTLVFTKSSKLCGSTLSKNKTRTENLYVL